MKYLKKVNRKVQGVPHSEAIANPWHQEADKKGRNWRMQNKQTNTQETHRPPSLFPKQDQNAKQDWEK